jgi:hypothetical protein
MKPVYGLKNQLLGHKSVMRCIQFDGAGHANGGVTTNCKSLLLGCRVACFVMAEMLSTSV